MTPSTPRLRALLPALAGAVVGWVGLGCGPVDLVPIRAAPASDAGGSDALAPPIDAGVAMSCKRGLAANAAPTAALAPSAGSPGVVWWYNWTTVSPGGGPGVEYVPMIWGGGSLTQAIPAGSRYLLGFNDPNVKSQANLTVAQAAADWPAVEALGRPAGIPLVSPGVGYCVQGADTSQCADPAIPDPYTYLSDFFAACAGCRVDYVALHAHLCDLASLRAFIEGNGQSDGGSPGFLEFGKPLWVTELACDATHSVAEQKAFMEAAVPYLEANPNVARYAWFSAAPIPNAMLTSADGSVTDLGATYAALPAACR
jgi:hypothetical protein